VGREAASFTRTQVARVENKKETFIEQTPAGKTGEIVMGQKSPIPRGNLFVGKEKRRPSQEFTSSGSVFKKIGEEGMQ